MASDQAGPHVGAMRNCRAGKNTFAPPGVSFPLHIVSMAAPWSDSVAGQDLLRLKINAFHKDAKGLSRGRKPWKIVVDFHTTPRAATDGGVVSWHLDVRAPHRE